MSNPEQDSEDINERDKPNVGIKMETISNNSKRFQVARVHSVTIENDKEDGNMCDNEGHGKTTEPASSRLAAQSNDVVHPHASWDNEQNEEVLEDDATNESRTGSPVQLLSPGQSTTVSDQSTGNDTKYGKSLRHLTREALPRLDHYRNVMSLQAAYRPTLDELHNETMLDKPTSPPQPEELGQKDGKVKFGWIKGVFIRCLLNIWGVMLFLRLSWVVGQAGIGQTLLLICVTAVVTGITSLSMSAISTNGQIKAGGTYFMISRSLGPEFGASIGFIFAVANAVACAMYIVGFAESMNDLLRSLDTQIVDNGVNDIRIVGSITIVVLLFIVVIGMEWEAKAQIVLLFILLVAIVDFIIGSFIGPMDEEEKAKGFVGYSYSLLLENMQSDYRKSEGSDQDFFSVFSVFFPAATGILAGANISGDLADPSSAIPKGTLLAVFLTTVSYLCFSVIAGTCMFRQASGNITEINSNLTSSFQEQLAYNCSTRHCEWGLHNSFQVMELISAFGPLVYAGCFAATLSSALASLVSAPKVFQALCMDNLYPYIGYFGKGFGKNGEPLRSYVLTFFIALGFIIVAELNAIAPLISNFFLAAYALINFSTFHASLVKSVGWRPMFKFYNMWLSLLGSGLCVAVMFIINWWTALLTYAFLLALYLVIIYRKPDVNWGSSTQAQTYKTALASVQTLSRVEEHVKNYRPQVLVMSGMPNTRPPLMDFAYMISKNLSLMLCGHIVKSPQSQQVRNALTWKSNNWLRLHKMKAFYTVMDDISFEDGARALMQASGVGKLKPNLLLMGYKGNWISCDRGDLQQYFNVIHKAFDMYLAVGILRVQEGLDYAHVIGEDEELSPEESKKADIQSEAMRRNQSNQSFTQVSLGGSSSSEMTPAGTPLPQRHYINVNPNVDIDKKEINVEAKKKKKKKKGSVSQIYRGPGGIELPRKILDNITQFRKKQKKSTIDVWWLYDDGGLTLLLPYIITTRPNWSSCKLRIFTLASKHDELEIENRSMVAMLSKFRIDYSDVIVIPDVTKKPQDSTRKFFESLIRDFRKADSTSLDEVVITESELLAQKDKSNRHMRLRELVGEHSLDSTLVVMTLPMPRKGAVSAPLYMTWLELLTRGMPPFLLLRGNQTSVLTFYS